MGPLQVRPCRTLPSPHPPTSQCSDFKHDAFYYQLVKSHPPPPHTHQKNMGDQTDLHGTPSPHPPETWAVKLIYTPHPPRTPRKHGQLHTTPSPHPMKHGLLVSVGQTPLHTTPSPHPMKHGLLVSVGQTPLHTTPSLHPTKHGLLVLVSPTPSYSPNVSLFGNNSFVCTFQFFELLTYSFFREGGGRVGAMLRNTITGGREGAMLRNPITGGREGAMLRNPITIFSGKSCAV